MQLLAPILLLTASLASASATSEQQQPAAYRRQIPSNSTLVTVQAAETGILRAGAPSPTDLGLGSNRFSGFAGEDSEGYILVSAGSAQTAGTVIRGLLGVVGAIVGGAMLL
ncbi:hypothetical protein B0T21DRAFT_451793 [Apiosordaria backusii]|uniref:Uncharacterized protein n=1 Tax=Apiosordaria backusii TaxID=314023 RepID=A0AA40BK97_9PEZI|nr:hypothetical protein B0T21DRAFT_451793 [Apiosordaria backusii]